MKDALIAHIRKTAYLTREDIDILEDSFDAIQLRKKEVLQSPGKISAYKYFINKGCLRSYFINEKGVEQILQFAIENWWIADYESFDREVPSTLYIDAIENSEVFVLERSRENYLYNKIPAFEHYFRKILEKERTAFLMKLRYMLQFSKEESYLHFSKNFPQFVERVPDYMIASYLNITPEYLSVIRKRIIS